MKHYAVGDIIRILRIFVKQAGWKSHVEDLDNERIIFSVSPDSPDPFYQESYHVHNALIIMLAGANWENTGTLFIDNTLEMVIQRRVVPRHTIRLTPDPLDLQPTFSYSNTKKERST